MISGLRMNVCGRRVVVRTRPGFTISGTGLRLIIGRRLVVSRDPPETELHRIQKVADLTSFYEGGPTIFAPSDIVVQGHFQVVSGIYNTICIV